MEKPTTDNDISKNLQLGKIGHDENIKNILIEESTNPSNIDILEPEQHKANTIQFRNEILTLETTTDLGNQVKRKTYNLSETNLDTEIILSRIQEQEQFHHLLATMRMSPPLIQVT